VPTAWHGDTVTVCAAITWLTARQTGYPDFIPIMDIRMLKNPDLTSVIQT